MVSVIKMEETHRETEIERQLIDKVAERQREIQGNRETKREKEINKGT